MEERQAKQEGINPSAKEPCQPRDSLVLPKCLPFSLLMDFIPWAPKQHPVWVTEVLSFTHSQHSKFPQVSSQRPHPQQISANANKNNPLSCGFGRECTDFHNHAHGQMVGPLELGHQSFEREQTQTICGLNLAVQGNLNTAMPLFEQPGLSQVPTSLKNVLWPFSLLNRLLNVYFFRKKKK